LLRPLDWLRWTGAKLRRLSALGFVLAGMAAGTWLALKLGLNLASTGFLYLVFVLLAAVYGGFWQATTSSIVAVGCLDYFFIQPLSSFAVSDPRNWLALAAFEFTAVVVSRISHQAQAKADEAVAERRDTERLYKTSQQILMLDRSRDPGEWIPRVICELFGVPGVVLFDAISVTTRSSGTIPPGAEERTRAAYYANEDTFDPAARAWFCALRFGVKPVGSLGLIDCELSSLAATSLASLSAIAMERKRSYESELRAEAAQQAERLRTAVLDALAHEFKTPLTTIRTASSGLLAAGALSPGQAELVTLIDDEATELNNLASRLLQAARLESANFRPTREILLLSSIIPLAVEALKQPSVERFQFSVPPNEIPVKADRKLMTTALAQILENAIKYSDPESPVAIAVTMKDSQVRLSVHNQGSGIPAADREKIFERFYRGTVNEQRPPGTGLGLSIVKRIMEAHHGHVWVEGDERGGTTFVISLPAASHR
jgi:two-component system sensor histidine kinase KdpD